MNDIIIEKIDDLNAIVEQIRENIETVAEFEARLFSFRETAGRLGNDINVLRVDTEHRLRALEKNDYYKSLLFGCIIGAAGFATGVLMAVFYLT